MSGTRTQAIEAVDDFFDGVFAPLERWRPQLIETLTNELASGPMNGSQLTALVEASSHRILDLDDRPVYGAGFCASSAVVDSGNPLAWWQGSDRSLLAASMFGPGQAAIDLIRLEWYRVPEETGEPYVAGPFVDYLCSNEITITSSLPVIVNGTFWGVICADVLVSSLESELLPVLPSDAALVNAKGRIVLSNAELHETGDRYRGEIEDGSRSAKYPFAVVRVAE